MTKITINIKDELLKKIDDFIETINREKRYVINDNVRYFEGKLTRSLLISQYIENSISLTESLKPILVKQIKLKIPQSIHLLKFNKKSRKE